MGVNLPWIRYGQDFGTNAWQPDGGVHVAGRRTALDEACARIAGAGLDVVRWFVLCDGRAGLVEDASGLVRGIDDAVRSDLDVALDTLQRHRLRAIFVLVDYLLCSSRRVVNGVQTGGRRHLVTRTDDRERFLETVIAPIVSHAGAAHEVFAWDAINEPEWVTLGEGTWRAWRAVTADAMRLFVAGIVGRVHAAGAKATVGLASTRGLDLVRGLGLDLYQVHWYEHVDDRSVLERRARAHALDAPILLGEYASAGSSCVSHDVLGLARGAGYAGALAWSLLADDAYSAHDTCLDELVAWRTRVTGATVVSSSESQQLSRHRG